MRGQSFVRHSTRHDMNALVMGTAIPHISTTHKHMHASLYIEQVKMPVYLQTVPGSEACHPDLATPNLSKSQQYTLLANAWTDARLRHSWQGTGVQHAQDGQQVGESHGPAAKRAKGPTTKCVWQAAQPCRIKTCSGTTLEIRNPWGAFESGTLLYRLGQAASMHTQGQQTPG